MILSLQRKMSDIKYRVNAMTFLKSITQEIAIVIVIFCFIWLNVLPVSFAIRSIFTSTWRYFIIITHIHRY